MQFEWDACHWRWSKYSYIIAMYFCPSLIPRTTDPGIIQLVNDTVIADPLMTIPINSNSPNQENLCYELHGAADNHFSLVSDRCTAVNAHYAAVENHTSVNIIDAITVRAVDSTNECQNIRASLDNCTADIGGVPLAVSSLGYSSNGISVRRFRNRIRISVPNCDDTSLVMWVLCTEGPFSDPVTDEEFSQRSIRFVIARGLNLNERSHGLLGKEAYDYSTGFYLAVLILGVIL